MINNINKPTTPFWNKVILACAAASAVISGAAYLYHVTWLQIAGIVCAVIGAVGPIFMPPGNDKPGEQV
jgi:hypothetical protein